MVKGLINSEDNNSNSQDDTNVKSTTRPFLLFQSKTIIGIYSHLQKYPDKDIEALFSNAVDLFNALGSWIYGGASPKIIYPELKLFIKNANNCSVESFTHFLDYINWLGNNLFKILEDNQWIQEHYYESFTIRKSNDVTTGLFFMWRIGWLIASIKDISKGNEVLNLLQLLKTLDTLFDGFGGWIFNQEGLTNITLYFHEFEKMLKMEFASEYDELLEEANKTRNNIANFIQKL